jgi:lipopolysaccharide export system permease protein
VLLAFRRLATSSELDVMRAVGVSYTRLLRVPYMYAIGLAVVNLLIVGYIQPDARYNYEKLRFELRTGALGASIKVGEFTQFGAKRTIRIEQSHDEGRKLSGIFVHTTDDKGGSFAVTADSGKFLATDNPDVIIFRLTNGILVRNEPGVPVPRVLRFTLNDLPINLPPLENFRQPTGRLELTLPQLARISGSSQVSEVDRDSSRAALHFRLTQVAAMFLLPLLALALGVPPKRSTSALGVFLSIIMIVTYFKVNQYAQGVGAAGTIDPFVALWVPFTIFAAIVFWMYYTIAYVPGGQPIGALERVSSKVGKTIGRWLPGRRKTEAAAI